MTGQKKSQKSILVVDNFDSFTYILADYLMQLGADVTILDRSNVKAESIPEFDGILFSPGPGNPTEMPDLLNLIKKTIYVRPVLGICLGFQALAAYYEGTVSQGIPKHGKISEVNQVTSGHWLFENVPQRFNVVRYHSLVVQNLKSPLEELAYSSDGSLMALAHEILPIAGFQFHPEAHLTEHGTQLLKNWLNLC